MILAVTLQLSIDPPLWLQLLIWIPVTAAMVIGGLRVAKGVLLALEYRNAAREGRLSDRSEEHTSELQSLMRISYAVFCLKKKITKPTDQKSRPSQQAKHTIIELTID